MEEIVQLLMCAMCKLCLDNLYLMTLRSRMSLSSEVMSRIRVVCRGRDISIWLHSVRKRCELLEFHRRLDKYPCLV